MGTKDKFKNMISPFLFGNAIFVKNTNKEKTKLKKLEKCSWKSNRVIDFLRRRITRNVGSNN